MRRVPQWALVVPALVLTGCPTRESNPGGPPPPSPIPLESSVSWLLSGEPVVLSELGHVKGSEQCTGVTGAAEWAQLSNALAGLHNELAEKTSQPKLASPADKWVVLPQTTPSFRISLATRDTTAHAGLGGSYGEIISAQTQFNAATQDVRLFVAWTEKEVVLTEPAEQCIRATLCDDPSSNKEYIRSAVVWRASASVS